MGNSGDGRLTADSTHFRLQRAGDELTASVSEDGTNWREIGKTTIKLPADVQIGVVAGHNKTVGFEATFEDFHVTKAKGG
jgi:regulation of enolase protein 1 (concanavalin A-like superfamily)